MVLAMGDPNNEDELNEDELLDAIRKKMRQDKAFKKNVADAIEQKNRHWLYQLVADVCKNVLKCAVIREVVGYVIDVLSG